MSKIGEKNHASVLFLWSFGIYFYIKTTYYVKEMSQYENPLKEKNI
jgi:hypothetical protein